MISYVWRKKTSSYVVETVFVVTLCLGFRVRVLHCFLSGGTYASWKYPEEISAVIFQIPEVASEIYVPSGQ